ncbi:mannose-6-phosphate isomerase, class I [Mycetocola reblochoni]|uniref:mannose-6-phosphate isomerase n=2 Tax=Mycetocola reblochoni TaxID=331618 RepID=A0A1R4K1A3_9MICO|nr:mannose-6-phosphate isomerase, class I [Mycetocola reblochoni]RLP70455.1 mannose-6-phosphate isomerase, class I [Mycetocola reblochoni]SJN38029.1 Mannose-6-phosphate isomerase [Mycetocola reblochoni REB411]
MFVPISNTPRPYAWGDRTAIAGLLGREASGGPEAELWLGAHSGSPATILDPEAVGGYDRLDEWIAADPERAIGSDRSRLPFLLKVLAAARPLSLQAHPSAGQAVVGYEKENAAGVPVDAPDRNYRDAYHKPELILALSDRFQALCGFRPLEQTRLLLAALVPAGVSAEVDELRELLGADGDAKALRRSVRWILTGTDEQTTALIDALTAGASRKGVEDFAAERATLLDLAGAYPGDPGVVVALLLNRVELRRGQVLFLPAGNIHAYLEGLGIELMAASDNVLRGGLTSKHVDVPELLAVLDFTPIDAAPLAPERLADGVVRFDPDVPDFSLVHALGDDVGPVAVPVRGPVVVLATGGSFELRSSGDATRLVRGEAVYVTPGERELTIEGSGELFIATIG